MEKIVPFWPVGYVPSNTAQAMCHISKYLSLNIFNIGFRLRICVYNDIQYLYRRFNTTIKSSTEVNHFDLLHVC